MTVDNQTTTITGLGNNSATVFSYSPLTIFDQDDLEVTHVVISTSVATTLVRGTGPTKYAVSPSTFALGGATGNVTYPADAVTPMTTDEKIIVKRVLTLEQSSELENQGGYFADVQEENFDKAVMIALQQQEEIDRSLKMSLPNAATTTLISGALVALNVLRINAAADAIEAVAFTTTVAGASDLLPSDVNTTIANAGVNGEFARADHTHFMPHLARAKFAKGADLASATTMALGTDGAYFDVTGTTDIDTIQGDSGRFFILQFDGVLTLGDDANMVLGGRDIITHAGMHILFFMWATNSPIMISILNGERPAFQAIPASDQDDIATGGVTVVLGTEIFDLGGDFATNTFTAPVAGKYSLSFSIDLDLIDGAATLYEIELVTSNRTYRMTRIPTTESIDRDTFALNVLADMDAADTAVLVVDQTSGSAQTDIQTSSFFSGYLLSTP